jgi:hypothetical protein
VFWQQFQQFANHDSFLFRRRGRGCRALAGDQYGIPLHYSEKWAVYVIIKGERTLTVPDLLSDRSRMQRLEQKLLEEKALADSALTDRQRWRDLYDQLSDEMDKIEKAIIRRYANERSRYKELAAKVIIEKNDLRKLAQKEYNRLLLLTALLSGFLAITLFLLIH